MGINLWLLSRNQPRFADGRSFEQGRRLAVQRSPVTFQSHTSRTWSIPRDFPEIITVLKSRGWHLTGTGEISTYWETINRMRDEEGWVTLLVRQGFRFRQRAAAVTDASHPRNIFYMNSVHDGAWGSSQKGTGYLYHSQTTYLLRDLLHSDPEPFNNWWATLWNRLKSARRNWMTAAFEGSYVCAKKRGINIRNVKRKIRKTKISREDESFGTNAFVQSPRKIRCEKNMKNECIQDHWTQIKLPHGESLSSIDLHLKLDS